MDKNSENQLNGGGGSSSGARKINVSYKDAEQEFKKVDRTLEDIVNEELSENDVDPGVDEIFEESVEKPSVRFEEPKPEEKESSDMARPLTAKVLEDENESAREIRDVEGIDERPVKAGKKSGKGTIIVLLILMILLVVGFAAYYLLSTQTIKNDFFAGENKCEECKCGDSDKKEPVVEKSDEEEVVSVLNEISNEFQLNHGGNGMPIVYNYSFPAYKINEDGTYFNFSKSYGIYDDAYNDDLEFIGQLNSEAITVLMRNGFQKNGELDFIGTYEIYENSESDIVCKVSKLSLDISCSRKEWVNKDNEELAVALAEAYKAKTGESLLLVYASESDIQDDFREGYNYQTIIAGGAGFGMMFYRKNANSEWVYATGGQSTPKCSEFDEEAREAFKGYRKNDALGGSGMTCYNEETGEEEEL